MKNMAVLLSDGGAPAAVVVTVKGAEEGPPGTKLLGGTKGKKTKRLVPRECGQNRSLRFTIR